MRGVSVAALMAIFLSVASIAPIARAKAPVDVDIQAIGSGIIVASISSPEDLEAFALALLGTGGTRFLIPGSLQWDYRILALWNEVPSPMELWYRAPRGDVLGTLCCLDADASPLWDPTSPDARYVLQSQAFDAVLLKYVQLPEADGGSVAARLFAPWAIAGIVGAAILAFLAVLGAAGRTSRKPATGRP